MKGISKLSILFLVLILAAGSLTLAGCGKSASDSAAVSLTDDVPYVGMPESEIGNTSLGSPLDKVRDQYDTVDGKTTLTHYYYFVQNQEYVFTVQCAKGVVYRIWDYRMDDSKVRYRPEKQETTQHSAVPYIGMSERLIGSTSLGPPSGDVRHNNAGKNGKVYTANIYDFYQNGKCVFIARCVQGSVTDVWDYRDSDTFTYTTSSYSATSPKNKEKPSNNFYNNDPDVKGYYDPEDFYDDYKDDFFEYDEAETYYYDHGGF